MALPLINSPSFLMGHAIRLVCLRETNRIRMKHPDHWRVETKRVGSIGEKAGKKNSLKSNTTKHGGDHFDDGLNEFPHQSPKSIAIFSPDLLFTNAHACSNSASENRFAIQS